MAIWVIFNTNFWLCKQESIYFKIYLPFLLCDGWCGPLLRRWGTSRPHCFILFSFSFFSFFKSFVNITSFFLILNLACGLHIQQVINMSWLTLLFRSWVSTATTSDASSKTEQKWPPSYLLYRIVRCNKGLPWTGCVKGANCWVLSSHCLNYILKKVICFPESCLSLPCFLVDVHLQLKFLRTTFTPFSLLCYGG